MVTLRSRIDLDSDRKKVLSGAIGILIGVGLIALGLNTFVNQNQALENPVNVSATVIETGIDQESSRRSGIEYRPEIRFEYRFEGQEYTSNNMYPGSQQPDERDSETRAREVLQRYSEGSEITVYVPPDSPNEAFIRAEKTNDPLIFMAIGLVFLAIGVYKGVQDRF
ncbi:MAG: DUF3592 domain-containing protein [Candidatus Nanohaloarchaeota archaeon QJJ-5]|nr:DUF3592 domain-containing protein [Candidatus Nanohaloarchaeota archaeon QJJ-5]